MKKILFISSIVSMLGFSSGCSVQSPETEFLIKEDKKSASVLFQYNKVMEEMQWYLADIDGYVPIEMEDCSLTEGWYARLTYKLWNNDLEREDFLAKCLEFRPGYLKSFEVQADYIIENRYIK